MRPAFRPLVVLVLGGLAACRPPGYGKGGGGGDDMPSGDDTAMEVDGSVPMPDAPVQATCTKQFRLDGHSLASSVLLTGDFVAWSPTAPPAVMLAKGGDGAWTGSYDFTAGSHQYKYIVDGNWIVDPTNPNQVDDGMGHTNSVITCTP